MRTQSELELELYQIAGYLPHGMCYQYPIIPADWDGKTKLKTGIDVFDFGFHYSGISDLLYYKPVLRPDSDMYKPILHNGKEQIPILECAKMVLNADWKLDEPNKRAITTGDLLLYFSRGSFLYYSKLRLTGIEQDLFRLFDFLHELKIDYRGLINAGLAIDCNTLEENPYK